MEARTLICEGRLVATAELADTYGYDTDAYDHLFLFRRAAATSCSSSAAPSGTETTATWHQPAPSGRDLRADYDGAR